MSDDQYKLDIEMLKRDVSEMKLIHSRIDNAIDKISNVSNSINIGISIS